MAICSFNPDDVGGAANAYWYNHPNGSIVYCDYIVQCNATTTADPDIGGTGVMASFIIMAGITVAAASMSALLPIEGYHDKWQAWRMGLYPLSDSDLRMDYSHNGRRRWLTDFANYLLVSLCDLQLITGSGILIAGLVQVSTISTYHFTMVYTYWSLTFNSMWAAQMGAFAVIAQPGDKWFRIRDKVQRVAIILTVGGALAFSFLLTLRLKNWDPFEADRCFRYSDKSSLNSNWFWWAGTVIFFLGACVDLFDRGSQWHEDFDIWVTVVERRLATTCQSLYQSSQNRGPRPVQTRTGCLGNTMALATSVLGRHAYTVGLVLCLCLLVFWWMLRQFMALWAIGNGTPVIGAMIYCAFFLWNAIDVSVQKILTLPLLTGSETSWGFGQLLPMILIGSILLTMVDACKYASESAEERDKKIKSSPGVLHVSTPRIRAPPFFGLPMPMAAQSAHIIII